MNGRLEQRVQKLEGVGLGNSFPRLKVLVAEDGETSRNCIIRNVHDPDAAGALFVILRGVRPRAEQSEACV